jgi:hypothetical protein
MQKSPNKDPTHKAITKAVQNMVVPLVSEMVNDAEIPWTASR